MHDQNRKGGVSSKIFALWNRLHQFWYVKKTPADTITGKVNPWHTALAVLGSTAAGFGFYYFSVLTTIFWWTLGGVYSLALISMPFWILYGAVEGEFLERKAGIKWAAVVAATYLFLWWYWS